MLFLWFSEYVMNNTVKLKSWEKADLVILPTYVCVFNSLEPANYRQKTKHFSRFFTLQKQIYHSAGLHLQSEVTQPVPQRTYQDTPNKKEQGSKVKIHVVRVRE